MEADQLLLQSADVFVTMYLINLQNNYFDNAISLHDTNERLSPVALQFAMRRTFISDLCDLA